MGLPFFKAEASGNDFIVVDERDLETALSSTFIQTLCDSKRGIGADGLLLVKGAPLAQMRIFNKDGSEAAFCGNGLRATALYLAGRYERQEWDIRTRAGAYKAEVSDTGIKVHCPPPTQIQLHKSLLGKEIHLINTGVPHLVTLIDDIETADFAWAKKVRFHPSLGPEGSNVNFLSINDLCKVRTYERGVEAETLSCGSGTLAAACIAVLLHKIPSPILLQTRSKEILQVNLSIQDTEIESLTLTGPATLPFSGLWHPICIHSSVSPASKVIE